jgi:hypothetical protein
MTAAPRIVTATLIAAVTLAAAPSAPATAAEEKSCKPVRNPYPGTRYDGVDLTSIRTLGASCKTARRVARRAHRKALQEPPSADGIRRFEWNGWRVRGDLRPARDKYVARKGTRRVRWRF